MLEFVSIRNWQSLVSVELELARFTVIVGPSSSGKSAFIRALRAVASNVSGTATITRGAKNAAIAVRTGEHIVTLEYGRYSTDTVAGWYYRVQPVGGKQELYTKLNRAVPAQVTEALGIHPVPARGTSINFAGQHDAPYLLADSGAAIAHVLGELTGVDRIFDAGREAIRRRNAMSATLKTREADLAALTATAATFAALPGRQAALRAAELSAESAAQLTDRINRLRTAADKLTVAEAVLSRALPPDVPTLTAVEQAQQRLSAFQALCRMRVDQQRAAVKWQAEVEQLGRLEQELHEELCQVLRRAGTCPTCQQPIPAPA